MGSIREHLSALVSGLKGGSTSLVEASAVIGIGAVLAGTASVAGVSSIDESKMQAAREDAVAIGWSVLTFYQDNNVFPMFKDGTKVGPNDDQFQFLASANGNFPVDNSLPVTTSGGITLGTWRVIRGTSSATTGLFGEMLDYSTYDSLENQLNLNTPGRRPDGSGFIAAYPLQGQLSADQKRGWNGPYGKGLPATDPWGNKYLVNVQEVSTSHLLQHKATGGGGGAALPMFAVLVISSGPNRAVETSSEQDLSLRDAVVGGDDVVYRIR